MVIHARMGSSRFPGKMVAPLGNAAVLEWVIRRSTRTRGISEFVLATSSLSQDDVLYELGEMLGIRTFRGSHEDVLQRVIQAADRFDPAAVVRVCADNPFIDPELVSELVAAYRDTQCDYMFNHRPGLGLKIADGFGGEVFRFSALQKVAEMFPESRYREHLTSPFWEHQELFEVVALDTHPELVSPDRRFDVDTPEDLAYLNDLVRLGGITFDTRAERILEISHRA